MFGCACICCRRVRVLKLEAKLKHSLEDCATKEKDLDYDKTALDKLRAQLQADQKALTQRLRHEAEHKMRMEEGRREVLQERINALAAELNDKHERCRQVRHLCSHRLHRGSLMRHSWSPPWIRCATRCEQPPLLRCRRICWP